MLGALLKSTVGFILPEMVNGALRGMAKAKGESPPPLVQDGQTTMKGTRTILVGLVLVGGTVGQWLGWWQVDMDFYHTLAALLGVTITLKAAP